MHHVDIQHQRTAAATRTAESRRKTTRHRLLLSTRKAMLMSAITIAAGSWISFTSHDWSWLARSGSLVVIIGMFLTSSQIIENSRKLKNRRACSDHNFTRDFADDIKRDTLERSRSLDEELWESGLRGLYLLVAGTLIWGFGDLVGVLLG